MRQFAKAFRSPGNEVDVIAVRRGNLPKREAIDGVNVYRIQTRSLLECGTIGHLIQIGTFLFRAAVVIGWKHWRNPYDVIHVQSIPDFLVFSALIPKIMGCPVILDLRDLVPELYASKFMISEHSWLVRVLKAVERLSVRFADHVIVANPLWFEKVVHRSADVSKCSIFWYYPDTELFYPRIRARTDNRFKLLYPGCLHYHQGVDVAIRAFSKILQHIPEAELHIMGNGPAKSDLSQLTQELHLEGNVLFDEAVPLDSVPDYMAQCDIGLVTKKASDIFGNEAASTKISEFMAVGIPVVASRTKIDSDLYDDSLLSYFQSENEDALADAVISLYRDPLLRQRFISNGRRYVETNNWASRVPQYTELVKDIVNGRCRTT
jgi:glycosyltransferase involved in cell wall biosynthesis